ncbi:MAG: UdgX family uracil-DNA binding protein [Planctomycetaceae bacterium]|nr:UdgX family uracil-DNA binding protein [Planctomycetaceae bacterium]
MTAKDFLPKTKSLAALQSAVQNCQGCELYQRATQAVFGHGPATASIVIIGEQPGNEEDLAGLPFVGPAGHRLDQAMQEAGILRESVYLTNAVKHFSWEERGPRRLHKRPSSREIKACEPWLANELVAINAKVVVCLGAVAAQVMLGREFKITMSRGQPILKNDKYTIATWHPSAILRAPEKVRRDEMHRELVTDLQLASSLCSENAD